MSGPQVSAEHYANQYDHRGRWSSYWLQIDYAKEFAALPLLEVGIGNGVTTRYLREVCGAEVTTVDIDPELRPDIVADITKLPFNDDSFGCVIACEVLEHLPYAQVDAALTELRRVANSAVVSVPNANRYYWQLTATLGSRRKRLIALSAAWLFPKRSALSNQHFWELEARGVPKSKFIKSIGSAGWRLVKEFRNPDHPYHHFFILR